MSIEVIFVIAGVALVIGFLVGVIVQRADSEQRAVKAGHAKYNEITREFEWK